MTEQCTEHQWNGGIVTTAATCIANGIMTYTCVNCGSKKEVLVSSANHSYGAWQTAAAPTCTTEGLEEQTCSVCKTTNSRAITALGHNWVNSDGTKSMTCTRCGATQCTDSEHSWGEWTVTADAMCTVPGCETRTCAKCGKTEARDVNALGHTWETVLISDAVRTMNDQNHDTTYVRYLGYTDFTIHQCSRCHDIDRDTLEFIYTPYEAAEVALGYVNELRGEYYGDEKHYLVLDTTLIELANIRARELEIVCSHYSPSGLWTNAGENITGSGCNIKTHYINFYNEEYHKINMLHEEYQYFGYGLYHPSGEDGWDDCGVYGAQLFWDENSRDWYIFKTSLQP